MEIVKARVKALKIEIHALAIAYRDSRAPWTAKACVVYSISPIDLIPDFIPV